ncbi:MAG: hypothetical protein AB1705_14030 [Verrucomicrobiota bacterium]
MKVFIAILLSAGVGFGGAYVYVSNQKSEQFRKERAELQSQFDSEKDKLEKDLKRAQNKPIAVEQVTQTVEVPVSDRRSPRQIIERLSSLKAVSGSDQVRYASIRRIVHELESLADHGQGALPAIRAFLASNQDISYERERERREGNNDPNAPQGGPPQPGQGGGPGGFGGFGGGGPGGPGGFGGGGFRGPSLTTRTESYYPYSLRLGLFDIVKQIGGPAAEQVLVEVLSVTARGVEVAHLAKLLDEMAPNKYRPQVIAAAKELLLQPIEIPNPTDLDRQSKAFLYGILAEYKDTSFASNAQALLVSAEGRIDRSALAYLNEVLKEQAMPALYQAYKDARITNNFEKGTIINASMNYLGANPTSDQMFRELMATESQTRYMALFRANDGDNLSKEVLQNRINLLSSLNMADERLAEGVRRMISDLNRKLNPTAAGSEDRRFRGPGGPGGPGGGVFGGRDGGGFRGRPN